MTIHSSRRHFAARLDSGVRPNMENFVTCSKIALALLAALTCTSAFAGDGCRVSLAPVTKGFFLNPTLEKVVVVKAISSNPERPCVLVENDELLQVNDRVLPGSNAKDTMAYWKSLPKDASRSFKVRRNGAEISVVSK